MLFVMDIGNTNIVFGVYEDKHLIRSWRASSDRQKTADEYGMLVSQLFFHSGLSLDDIEGVVISSVVPPLMPEISRMCKRYLKKEPLIVGPGVRTGLRIRYDNPREVGADRIVNAVAACELYGAPVIVVDFGTATTFCAIAEEGEYLGGVIAPGIGIASEALFQRAAKLPRVEIAKPETVVGRNTVKSMQSGIVYGFVGQVDEIVRRMKQELGWRCRVIATGGLAELIAGESSQIDEVCPNLTLEGLRLIYEMNRG
ncbi:MAG: type III pantothenate kinase [Firmicutes bacterium]|nr:type III pantothenate kinase [Bacillota bacterium]